LVQFQDAPNTARKRLRDNDGTSEPISVAPQPPRRCRPRQKARHRSVQYGIPVQHPVDQRSPTDLPRFRGGLRTWDQGIWSTLAFQGLGSHGLAQSPAELARSNGGPVRRRLGDQRLGRAIFVEPVAASSLGLDCSAWASSPGCRARKCTLWRYVNLVEVPEGVGTEVGILLWCDGRLEGWMRRPGLRGPSGIEMVIGVDSFGIWEGGSQGLEIRHTVTLAGKVPADRAGTNRVRIRAHSVQNVGGGRVRMSHGLE
jgi:hypothetical protein